MKSISVYLTDHVANYEEIEPYLLLRNDKPLAIIGFDADRYDPNAPVFAKGSDGNHHN